MTQGLYRIFLGIGMVAMTGCAEWPRASHLPDEGDEVPGSTHPGDLFEGMTWDSRVEASEDGIDDNNDPVASSNSEGVGSLTFGAATVITGELNGTGWNEGVEKPLLPALADCEAVNLFENALDSGFYVGDLDFFTFTVSELEEEEALLCGIAESSNDILGWDLLLVDLKDCTEPASLIMEGGDESSILGYGMGGPTGYWTAPVEEGGHYALLFAGYNVPVQVTEGEPPPIGYRIGAALTHVGSSNSAICPNLPEIVSEDAP